MKKSNVTLRGIVVAGDSRQQAEANYRAVATGVSVRTLRDEDSSFVILSNADSELTLMNPLSGDMNMVEASDIAQDRFEFVASDSDETVTTFYTLCSEGCGSHLIADDPELMQRCPVCASDLADLSEDEISSALATVEDQADVEDDITASDADEDREPNALIVSASSFDLAAAAYRELVAGELDSADFDCETGIVVSCADTPMKFSPYTGEAASITQSTDEACTVQASASGDYDAHWYQCASEECGEHVISSSDSPVFCPVCSSGLIEPENMEDEDYSMLSSDCDDEDEDEDEDDLDPVLDDEDEDEDEDEEYSMLSSDDEDDEDEDDDDEDDDDGDDEDEDEDDDDFDDTNSMSVSSVTIDDGEPASDLISVSTNLLSLASAVGELHSDKLEVAFAGDINGVGTWVAFYEARPIATATESTSSTEKSVFNGPVFGKMVHASAKENGVLATLNELGFVAIEASVDVDTYVQDEIATRVESGIAEASGKFDQRSGDFTSRFQAAVATAATGINKNFFENVNNPVKGALVSTMSSLGIRNAERLVAQAFAKHNDAYLQNLVAKAGEIMEYDVEIQNQLTKAVAATSAEQVATASADGDEPLSIGKPAATGRETVQPQPIQQQAHASAGDSKPRNLDAVLSTLGRRSRT